MNKFSAFSVLKVSLFVEFRFIFMLEKNFVHITKCKIAWKFMLVFHISSSRQVSLVKSFVEVKKVLSD